ncbi:MULTISPECIES: hypothetical protein [unclassified Leptolyngbya]|nr:MULTISPECIES: hypothetical protein [unclassified Leptolyngbya]MBD1914106.1 hypothetical protein [Leptolyngbya sp. FACHB-8]MBD2157297.1 hypothetical protein [Leptolyngbya sp. FACHB-16]
MMQERGVEVGDRTAGTVFGTFEFLDGVRKRSWRPIVVYEAIGRCKMVAA